MPCKKVNRIEVRRKGPSHGEDAQTSSLGVAELDPKGQGRFDVDLGSFPKGTFLSRRICGSLVAPRVHGSRQWSPHGVVKSRNRRRKSQQQDDLR